MENTNAILSLKLNIPGSDQPIEFELGKFSINLFQNDVLRKQATDVPPLKPEEDDLISTDEMAMILDKSPSTLRNWVREGKISVCRIGRSVFFNKRTVIEEIKKLSEPLPKGQIRVKKN